MMLLWATVLVVFAGRAAGHGAMVYPRPRNSIDAFVVPPAEQKGFGFKGSCANITGAPCRNGQSAFWFVAPALFLLTGLCVCEHRTTLRPLLYTTCILWKHDQL